MSDPHSTGRPSERFAGDAAVIRLDEIARELGTAAAEDAHGRAQRVVYRSGPMTIAMFAFKPDASLPTHSAPAVVSIHVFRGRVSATAGNQAFEIGAGSMLRLEPRTPHSVRAIEPSVIVVHIGAVAG